MEDFKRIVSIIMELLSIEIPVFGFRFSFMSIIIAMVILSIAIGFVVAIFGGDK